MTSDDAAPAQNEPGADPWAPGRDEPARPAPRRRGLFLTAVILFSIGVVFTILAAVTPFLLGHDAPSVLYVAAMLFTPVGFLLGIAYAILGSRPRRM
ncbi:MAG TPA: hypothetical protein H9759_01200 [Candidatus Dietzia intestinipullorum]|nr:hypothetical protein [Candidatus Dietzia intestinipullorum]